MSRIESLLAVEKTIDEAIELLHEFSRILGGSAATADKGEQNEPTVKTETDSVDPQTDSVYYNASSIIVIHSDGPSDVEPSDEKLETDVDEEDRPIYENSLVDYHSALSDEESQSDEEIHSNQKLHYDEDSDSDHESDSDEDSDSGEDSDSDEDPDSDDSESVDYSQKDEDAQFKAAVERSLRLNSDHAGSGMEDKQQKTAIFQPGDLVWVKVHKYWPCLVCEHSTNDGSYKVLMLDSERLTIKVDEKYMKPFDAKLKTQSSPQWYEAVVTAYSLSLKSKGERLDAIDSLTK